MLKEPTGHIRTIRVFQDNQLQYWPPHRKRQQSSQYIRGCWQCWPLCSTPAFLQRRSYTNSDRIGKSAHRSSQPSKSTGIHHRQMQHDYELNRMQCLQFDSYGLLRYRSSQISPLMVRGVLRFGASASYNYHTDSLRTRCAYNYGLSHHYIQKLRLHQCFVFLTM